MSLTIIKTKEEQIDDFLETGPKQLLLSAQGFRLFIYFKGICNDFKKVYNKDETPHNDETAWIPLAQICYQVACNLIEIIRRQEELRNERSRTSKPLSEKDPVSTDKSSQSFTLVIEAMKEVNAHIQNGKILKKTAFETFAMKMNDCVLSYFFHGSYVLLVPDFLTDYHSDGFLNSYQELCSSRSDETFSLDYRALWPGEIKQQTAEALSISSRSGPTSAAFQQVLQKITFDDEFIVPRRKNETSISAQHENFFYGKEPQSCQRIYDFFQTITALICKQTLIEMHQKGQRVDLFSLLHEIAILRFWQTLAAQYDDHDRFGKWRSILMKTSLETGHYQRYAKLYSHLVPSFPPNMLQISETLPEADLAKFGPISLSSISMGLFDFNILKDLVKFNEMVLNKKSPFHQKAIAFIKRLFPVGDLIENAQWLMSNSPNIKKFPQLVPIVEHCNEMHKIPLILKHVENVIHELLAFPSNTPHEKKLERLADIHWWLAQATPFERGSAACTEVLLEALFDITGLPSPRFSGVPDGEQEMMYMDLEAILRPRDAFVALYPSLLKKLSTIKMDK